VLSFSAALAASADVPRWSLTRLLLSRMNLVPVFERYTAKQSAYATLYGESCATRAFFPCDRIPEPAGLAEIVEPMFRPGVRLPLAQAGEL
jgi:hypothetical protein